MESSFVVDHSSRLRYAALALLKEMQEETYHFYDPLEDNETVLKPILEWLLEKNYVALESNEYRPTTKGQAFLWSFWDRYNAFLSDYDVYCGVDLTTGDFAFRYFEQHSDLDSWYEFLDEERWDDLRIAVAEYKGFDALEIVFMSFVVDKRFGRDGDDWYYDLLLGTVWDEIQMICNNSIRYKSLQREAKQSSYVDPENFIDGMIEAGEILVSTLRKSGYLGSFSRRI